jgi:hypothetical protein
MLAEICIIVTQLYLASNRPSTAMSIRLLQHLQCLDHLSMWFVQHIHVAIDNALTKTCKTAGVKGLMAGAAVIQRRDGSKIQLGNVQSGILVPSMEEVLSMDLSRIKWILVVEKEASIVCLTQDLGMLTLPRQPFNPSCHVEHGMR